MDLLFWTHLLKSFNYIINYIIIPINRNIIYKFINFTKLLLILIIMIWIFLKFLRNF